MSIIRSITAPYLLTDMVNTSTQTAQTHSLRSCVLLYGPGPAVAPTTKSASHRPQPDAKLHPVQFRMQEATDPH